MVKETVLFICSFNSVRSRIAQGLVSAQGRERYIVDERVIGRILGEDLPMSRGNCRSCSDCHCAGLESRQKNPHVHYPGQQQPF